jgi:predicted TIM-barrel fold metal-dependent hydrolase
MGNRHTATRRDWLAASLLMGALPSSATDQRRIIDSHIHLWKLPRNAPPMSDNAAYPTGCCGAVPWLEVDRLLPDYNAHTGGAKVDQVVLIESSVGVPPAKLLQSNRWMLQAASSEPKILSVVGKLDLTQPPAEFAREVAGLSANRQWVGIRIGAEIFQPGKPPSVSTILPNVLPNLALMARQGLQIDTLGIAGAVVSRIGATVPGLTIVMDHFAGKPTTLDVEDSWRADMHAAAGCAGVHVKVSDVHKLSSQAVTGRPAGLTQFQPIDNPARYAPVLDFLWKTFGEDLLIFGIGR